MKNKFTLVEMLTVIAIIGVLAAIVTPVVILARQRGMVTQAAGDINSLMAALKQMHSDYGRVLKKNGSSYSTGNTSVTVSTFSSGGESSSVAVLNGDAYHALIAELTAPKNSFFSSNPPSVNRRRKVYLDPRKEFNPAESCSAQTDALWHDPWNNAYVVYINVDMDDSMNIPDTSRIIPGNFAAYSFGLNGVDDKGCNADLDSSMCHDAANHREHDDIASWNL